MKTKTLHVGDAVSNDDLVSKLGLANEGGIRYRGKAEAPDDLVVIVGQNIYRDRVGAKTLEYRGTGRIEHQRLIKGNRALISYWVAGRHFRVFGQAGRNRCVFLGLFAVAGVSTELELDETGHNRAVLVFDLGRTQDKVAFWPR